MEKDQTLPNDAELKTEKPLPSSDEELDTYDGFPPQGDMAYFGGARRK